MFSPSSYYNADNYSPMLCPPRPLAMDNTWKPHVEIAPNCPRCASSNTKFCYYNNYSFSQPRYFCKACRRYWTKGGSIRNVPVGGGCRKSRRAKSSAKLRQSRSYTSVESLEKESSARNANGATEIDLAAVFAKYLNQDSSVSLDNMSSSTNRESVQDDTVMHGQDGCLDLQEVESLEGLAGNEVNAYELQSLLEEEVVSQDILWSDDAAVMPSLSTWDTQDFGGICSDVDQWKNYSTNDLMNEDWGTLDFSGFEVLSRPYL